MSSHKIFAMSLAAADLLPIANVEKKGRPQKEGYNMTTETILRK